MKQYCIEHLRISTPFLGVKIYNKILPMYNNFLLSSNFLRKNIDAYLPTLIENRKYFCCYSFTNNKGNSRFPALTLSKIVSTIGPTSEQFNVLQDTVSEGMNVMRLNFSHATNEEVELRVKNLKRCQVIQERYKTKHKDNYFEKMNVRGILLDTRGPEIRMGKLRDDNTGHKRITLHAGDEIGLHSYRDSLTSGSTFKDIYIDYPNMHTFLVPGSKVLLDDGAVSLTVLHVNNINSQSSNEIRCRVDNTGELRSRSGVNFPGRRINLPAMSPKDRDDIRYGLSLDIDYIAPSFVSSAVDIMEIKQYVARCANDLKWNPSHPLPLIISKIESISALTNFKDILKESDGIMVARGDLGVELPIQDVTNAQKEMIKTCNANGKPVIVATQMLESMTKTPRPTRAEVSDVSNAVHDGADAMMTSGETAKGEFPVETVQMMNDIILNTEKYINNRSYLAESQYFLANLLFRKQGSLSKQESLAKTAVLATHDTNVTAILVAGLYEANISILISAHRPRVPIIVFTNNEKIARQLLIYRGVYPVYGYLMNSPKKGTLHESIHYSRAVGFVNQGDSVVYVAQGENKELGEFVTMNICVVQ